MHRARGAILIGALVAGTGPAGAQEMSRTYTDSRGRAIVFPLGMPTPA